MSTIEVFLYLFFVINATIFGIVIGSFLNVVIYRIPEGRTIVKGHSMCMSCGHTLAAKDLVPLFSWLLLKGKCRYCGAPVASRYSKIESFTGLVFFIAAITHIQTAFVFVTQDMYFVSLAIYFVLFVVASCAAISAMMIYHDTGKGYLGLSLISLVSGLLTVVIRNINGEKISSSLLTIFMAALTIIVIKILFVVFHKKYSKYDLFADITIASLLLNSTYTKIYSNISSLLTLIIEFTVFAIVYGLIRAINKDSNKDKISVILGYLIIVILVILRYSIMKLVFNF